MGEGGATVSHNVRREGSRVLSGGPDDDFVIRSDADGNR